MLASGALSSSAASRARLRPIAASAERRWFMTSAKPITNSAVNVASVPPNRASSSRVTFCSVVRLAASRTSVQLVPGSVAARTKTSTPRSSVPPRSVGPGVKSAPTRESVERVVVSGAAAPP